MGKTYRKTSLALLLALGATLPAVGLAAASTNTERASVKVSYADLNIHSEAGAKALYARLKSASERVCDVGSFWEHGSITKFRDAKMCYVEVLSQAVENIDSDALSKIHSG